VVVTNGDGQSATLASSFTFNPPPGAFTVTPASVPRIGGNTTTISGSNFVSGATVKFGGIAATSVSFVNSSTLSVVTPAQNAGTYDVVVTNPDGQTATLSSGMTFTNVAPGVSSLTPNKGSVSGNTPVTITGQNFDAFYNYP
jgi:hypothetical protein